MKEERILLNYLDISLCWFSSHIAEQLNLAQLMPHLNACIWK